MGPMSAASSAYINGMPPIAARRPRLREMYGDRCGLLAVCDLHGNVRVACTSADPSILQIFAQYRRLPLPRPEPSRRVWGHLGRTGNGDAADVEPRKNPRDEIQPADYEALKAEPRRMTPTACLRAKREDNSPRIGHFGNWSQSTGLSLSAGYSASIIDIDCHRTGFRFVADQLAEQLSQAESEPAPSERCPTPDGTSEHLRSPGCKCGFHPVKRPRPEPEPGPSRDYSPTAFRRPKGEEVVRTICRAYACVISFNRVGLRTTWIAT